MKQMRESMQQEQIQPSENADPYLQGRPLVESVVMSDGDRNSENEMVLDMDIRDDSPEESNPYVDEFARSAQKNKQPHLKKSKNVQKKLVCTYDHYSQYLANLLNVVLEQ